MQRSNQLLWNIFRSQSSRSNAVLKKQLASLCFWKTDLLCLFYSWKKLAFFISQEITFSSFISWKELAQNSLFRIIEPLNNKYALSILGSALFSYQSVLLHPPQHNFIFFFFCFFTKYNGKCLLCWICPEKHLHYLLSSKALFLERERYHQLGVAKVMKRETKGKKEDETRYRPRLPCGFISQSL